MLKLALCSVEDVDHLVNTYQKNLEVKKNVELKIEEINAKFEKGAGSIIRMDNGCQRDPFKRSASYSELYQQLIDNNNYLNVNISKIQVVDQLLQILQKTNPIGAKIAEKRIKGISFGEIASEMNSTKMKVHRYWFKSLAKAIQNAGMIQYHVKS
ncbi:MAG: hypothetical protein CVU86_07035 [Firmicutes bacterium HGW-Firmicutes-11]|jgi:hypothetical protein|nr:MAG: hypothetical protein CVU94_00770 [Firmicutes bacterium HGW-Firmicutes-19]PKM84479.1 MAG: hypothetical protein CVU86_07035 [Firmicutes bacterium HGW-Firmicutes-11]